MIIDLQQRLAEVGRIRIGRQVESKNGKMRPDKLDTIRLTSRDKRRIEQAAGLYGGIPQQWESPSGPQWEVVTESDTLDVIVPPTSMAWSQWYEQWGRGGCLRRCDGVNEAISEGPCVCDPDERECEIHSRLSVMLSDLPGLGVWRLDTQGYYAAVELGAAVQILQSAAGRGQMLPARLRLEQRTVKRQGQPAHDFAVPVLDLDVSPAQLLAATTGQAAALAGPESAGEIASGLQVHAPLTPVPSSVPERPVASVAEQAAAVNEDRPASKRKNAQAPMPSTGVKPRTAEQAVERTPRQDAVKQAVDALPDETKQALKDKWEGTEIPLRYDALTDEQCDQVLALVERVA